VRLKTRKYLHFQTTSFETAKPNKHLRSSYSVISLMKHHKN